MIKNEDGENLEQRAKQANLKLIHDPKLPSSFNSGRWRKGYNPVNIFKSEHITNQATKAIKDPIPRTQHRPITSHTTAAVKPKTVPFKRCFNFKRAQWKSFAEDLDTEIVKINLDPESYEEFVELFQKISRKHILRGYRTEYIYKSGSKVERPTKKYEELYTKDPFSEDTIQAGEDLLEAISEERKEKWYNLLQETDMKHSSRKAWQLIKSLSNDPSAKTAHSKVTSDQVAHHLLLNGKVKRKT